MKEQFPPKKKEKESQKKGMKVERKDSPLKERRIFLTQGKKDKGKELAKGEDSPSKLQSSSKNSLLVPWTSLGRHGKGRKPSKERFVPSKETLGSQNGNHFEGHR